MIWSSTCMTVNVYMTHRMLTWCSPSLPLIRLSGKFRINSSSYHQSIWCTWFSYVCLLNSDIFQGQGWGTSSYLCYFLATTAIPSFIILILIQNQRWDIFLRIFLGHLLCFCTLWPGSLYLILYKNLESFNVLLGRNCFHK